MACFSPKRMFRTSEIDPLTGDYGWTLDQRKGFADWSSEVPCGQCIGCRRMEATDWRTRVVLESRLWPENVVVTLTYADEHLPRAADGRPTLVKAHHQGFMKRLRAYAEEEYWERLRGPGGVLEGFAPRRGAAIRGELRRLRAGGVDVPRPPVVRFWGCGEYGKKNLRPHYHVAIFNFRFDDAVSAGKSAKGNVQYRSPSLERLWPFGFATIGDLTEQTAMYIADYLQKKVVDPSRLGLALPAYAMMSNRPGIGAGVLDRWLSDFYPVGRVVNLGSKSTVRTPRYLDRKLKERDPALYREMKLSRRKARNAAMAGERDEVSQHVKRERRYAYAVVVRDRQERDLPSLG